jgi:hypothetical protein
MKASADLMSTLAAAATELAEQLSAATMALESGPRAKAQAETHKAACLMATFFGQVAGTLMFCADTAEMARDVVGINGDLHSQISLLQEQRRLDQERIAELTREAIASAKRRQG